MRASRLALAVALAAAAVLAALVSADVRAVANALEAGDARFDAREREAGWSAPTRLPGGVARTLLGVDDDLSLRRAAAAYRSVERARDDLTRGRRRARADAEAKLVGVISDGDRTQAGYASNLLGILAFADATTGRKGAAPVERSSGAFQDAIRFAPGAAAPKFNLELLFHQLEARGERIGPSPAAGFRGGGRRGAGGGVPGKGY